MEVSGLSNPTLSANFHRINDLEGFCTEAEPTLPGCLFSFGIQRDLGIARSN